MTKFIVYLAEPVGTRVEINAESWSVDDGVLMFKNDGKHCALFCKGRWVYVIDPTAKP